MTTLFTSDHEWLQIDGDVKNFARDDPDELPLRMRQLIMQSAKNPFPRARVIVLHEFDVDSRGGKFRPVVRLHEKAAFVFEDPRFDDNNPGQFGRKELHVKRLNQIELN